MSTKFFTNEDQNTLLHKFQGVFKHRKVHFFEVLVGFFRASGYFKIREKLKEVKQIRILVGIDVDSITAKYATRGSEIKFITDDIREDYQKKLQDDIQKTAYHKDVETGIKQFVEEVVNGKIQIKAHPSKKIHAKIYIFREEEKHDHGYGTVITGSSNLSWSGLENNFEFNVELRDNSDVDFALATFEKLWKEGTAINPETIAETKDKTYLFEGFTPFEIYIKFLIEYFGSLVDYSPELVGDLPKGFKRLSYQIDAVNEGFAKLKKYRGFFLSDVVGLGKTIVAAMIARRFYFANGMHTRTLIIVPPALKNGWEETLEKFEYRNYKIITNGSLHKIKYPQTYDLVIVDEAHKFRSSDTQGFNELQKIVKTPCKHVGRLITATDRRKRVILVSATPLNNRPEDLRNLVYLFQDAKDSTLEISNIQHFFAPLVEEYKKLKKEQDLDLVKEKVKAIYEQIRLNIVTPLTIRRTRTDIQEHEMYSKDLQEQGIQFPDIVPPKKILYQLDFKLDKLYDDSMKLLSKELEYARYQAIMYLIPEKKKEFPKADMVSNQLAKIMKTLLIKRLDSSFTAFKSSVGRFKRANQAMIKMFENNKIYIIPKLKGKVSEYIMNDEEDKLEEIALELMEAGENAMICTKDDFKEEFLEYLKADDEILTNLETQWNEVTHDPKFDEFLEKLDYELIVNNPEKKIVVFSESAVTTNYLKEQLNKKGRNDVLAISSANRNAKMKDIRANFDANLDLAAQRDDYKIIISTEVLAEGVNLHRANVIVNYDTPWNATRLMQRIGRINRVGSKASKVFIFNFFPTAKIDNDIDLKKRALMKLQAFHSALGEDSQIYSRQEDYETFGLFDDKVKEDKDMRLTYLMELRDYKDKHPEAFRRIKKMPLRARVGRKDASQANHTLTFIKTGKRDAFYRLLPEKGHEELTFVQAAEIFKATVKEKALSLPAFHYDHILNALQVFKEDGIKKAVAKRVVNKTKSPSEKKANAYLKAFLPLKITNEEDKEEIKWAIEMIRVGRYTQLPKAINKVQREAKKHKWKAIQKLEKLVKIIKDYSTKAKLKEKTETKTTLKKTTPEIIISESFC